jgi:peptidoglycan hydrolase-like protein with peptidoglycan-binding domain
VHVVTVPDVLIEIHPEWRGHQYFVARDEIVIVDSGHRIIATLPLGSSSSAQMEGSRGGGTQSATETEINLSSDEIRHMQIVLKEKGFDIGESDGIFGPKTRQALILFQERNGLQATGRIDVRTTTALGISTRNGQQGNQATGQQPTTGQTGDANKPSANQSPNDPAMNRSQNNQRGNPSGTTGQAPNNTEGTAPREDGNVRSNNNAASPPSPSQNNQNSGASPKSGGQAR